MISRLCHRLRFPWTLPRAALAALMVSSPAVAQQSGTGLIGDVARAMGGRDAVLAVRTLILQGTGENYNLGQNRTPDLTLPVYAVTKYLRAYDFQNSRWRQDQTREPRFPTGVVAPARQRVGYDVVGYDITSDTTMRRVGARPTLDRAAELIYHPVGFIQVALQPGAQVTEQASSGGSRVARLVSNGESYTMVVDRRTLLPLRIERTIHHNMLGDAVLSTELSNWSPVSGVQLPMRIVQRLDATWPLADLTISGAAVNGDPGDLALPANVKTAEVPTVPVNVTVDSIAPGIWYLTGGSHHSVVIEMSDHLVLVEAPLNDERTLQVIRVARALRPAKSLRTVINTHHHFDHSGGIRAALSEGLTVITHDKNRQFFQDLAKRRFTIAPDRFATNPTRPVIDGVSGGSVISDGRRTIDLREIQGSAHSESMLVVYLPAEKLLIEADLYSPQAANVTTPPVAPFAKDLVANIARLGLSVERIVPIHGRVVPVSDLSATAAAQTK